MIKHVNNKIIYIFIINIIYIYIYNKYLYYIYNILVVYKKFICFINFMLFFFFANCNNNLKKKLFKTCSIMN